MGLPRPRVASLLLESRARRMCVSPLSLPCTSQVDTHMRRLRAVAMKDLRNILTVALVLSAMAAGVRAAADDQREKKREPPPKPPVVVVNQPKNDNRPPRNDNQPKKPKDKPE